MYYEIYIDSLFLVNLVMNLYCLELVNLLFLRTATRKRVLFGAALGGILYLIPFLLPGPAWLKILIFFPSSAAVMILVTFRIRRVEAFFRVCGTLLLISFAFGGSLLFLFRIFPGMRRFLTGVLGILAIGALVFMEAAHLLLHKEGQELCRAELIGKGARITVTALLDTGNGLVEPISGKPVCILEKNVFDGLWRTGNPEGFRAIPYHSVGKKNGILYGYLLPEMKLEKEGMVIVHKNIYVGVSKDALSSSGGYCMIVSPALCCR